MARGAEGLKLHECYACDQDRTVDPRRGDGLGCMNQATEEWTPVASCEQRYSEALVRPAAPLLRVHPMIGCTAVGGSRRDDKPSHGDEDESCEQQEVCARVSGLVTGRVEEERHHLDEPEAER